jgi:hypothetical protein
VRALRLLIVLAALVPVAPAHAQVGAQQALEAAAATPEVRSERAARERTYLRAYREPERRLWRVSLFQRGRPSREVAQVRVDDHGRVVEAWTGVQLEWPMARGYPGAFGRAVNTPWIWAGLSLLFVLPFLRGPPRMLHLDLAVLLAFGLSYAAFNAAEIGISVPTVYPLLAYLLARMLWVAWHPSAPPRLRTSAGFLLGALFFLVGVRIALNLTGNVIDVGYASIIGADRLAHGEPLYGTFPDPVSHGDTYGPVAYAAYVPFELALPWTGSWDALPAGHAAALAFDLGCLALCWRLGGVLLAYLWASYPFTLLVSASGANDALPALLILAALLAAARPVARGALMGLAALTKLAPLVLVPLLVGRRPAAIAAFAATVAVVVAPFDLSTLLDRTVAFQAARDSPFSVWGDAGALQLLAQVAAAGLAVAVAFVPRRRDTATLAALAAAVVIAAQIGADHWFYTYLVWFAPLVWIALLSPAAAPARSPRPVAAATPG